MRSILLDTIQGKATERPPVWFMRQAGRVLPNYNKLKESHSFGELMRDVYLAAEITLMPIKDLEVDAAILFSDILVIPTAMGMELEWSDSGPKFSTPLTNFDKPANHLKKVPAKLEYIYEVIDQILAIRQENIPLIGFCGSPLTTFCYMMQGVSSNGNFPEAMKYFFTNKKESLRLIEEITDFSIHYAENQIDRGVDLFQLFETHAGLIPTEMYLEIIMPSVKKISRAIRDKGVPFIFFPRGLSTGLKYMSPELCDFVSIDWQMPLTHARELVHHEIGLQGNLDPRILYASKETIAGELEKFKPFFRNNPKWIFNLGHGFLPDTPYENARFVVEWVKSTNWEA